MYFYKNISTVILIPSNYRVSAVSWKSVPSLLKGKDVQWLNSKRILRSKVLDLYKFNRQLYYDFNVLETFL